MKDFTYYFRKFSHGIFKYELTIHVGKNHAVIQHFLADKRFTIFSIIVSVDGYILRMNATMGSRIDHRQFFSKLPVGMNFCGENASEMFVRSTDDHRTGSISKNDCYVTTTCREVKPHGMRLCTHQQDVFKHTASDIGIRDGQSIHKTTTLISNIKARNFCFIDPQLPLHQYATAREIIVWTQRGEDDEINFVGIDPGM